MHLFVRPYTASKNSKRDARSTLTGNVRSRLDSIEATSRFGCDRTRIAQASAASAELAEEPKKAPVCHRRLRGRRTPRRIALHFVLSKKRRASSLVCSTGTSRRCADTRLSLTTGRLDRRSSCNGCPCCRTNLTSTAIWPLGSIAVSEIAGTD